MLIGENWPYFYFLFFGISGKHSFGFPQINKNSPFFPKFIHKKFQLVFHNLLTFLWATPYKFAKQILRG